MSPTSTLRDLIDDTPRVLGDLTRFLDLHEPLWEEDRTSKLTGVPKYGDPGQYITTGNIVRDRSDDSDIELTDEISRLRCRHARRRLASSGCCAS
jgi:hypothetical protein